MVAFVVGNGRNFARLVRYGRGGNLEVVAYMAEHTAGPDVTIGGQGTGGYFRAKLVTAFFIPYQRVSKRWRYYDSPYWPPGGPEWVLVDSQAPASIRVPRGSGERYQLRRTFPFAGLSGWPWLLYHNTAFAAPAG
jgi:hypothetical protein